MNPRKAMPAVTVTPMAVPILVMMSRNVPPAPVPFANSVTNPLIAGIAVPVRKPPNVRSTGITLADNSAPYFCSAGSPTSDMNCIPAPNVLNTASASGFTAISTLFLNVDHFELKVETAAPAVRIVSLPAPADFIMSSRLTLPDFTAATNCAAPRVPKMPAASAIALASLPDFVNASIDFTVSRSAGPGAFPALANFVKPIVSAMIVLPELMPALSSTPTRAALSANDNPNCRNAGAPLVAAAASSLMPIPVAWEIWNSWSSAPDMSAALMPKALNDPVTVFRSRACLVIRPAIRNCRVRVSNTGPVRPRRTFSAVTVLPMSANDDGTFRPTLSADATKPSNALPVAPV